MLTHTYGYLGVVARVVTAPLEQAWEGAACVHTLQGQRGSFGRQPSLAPLTKHMRGAGSEAVALAQPTHQGNSANCMPRCSRAPSWRERARSLLGHRLSPHFQATTHRDIQQYRVPIASVQVLREDLDHGEREGARGAASGLRTGYRTMRSLDDSDRQGLLAGHGGSTPH